MLQGQQPPLCQKRSPVHGWGLYAAGPIAANVFVIEYIGELLRRPLDDVREKVRVISNWATAETPINIWSWSAI